MGMDNSQKYIAKISWIQVAILIPETGTWNIYLNYFMICHLCWEIKYETCRYHIIQDGPLCSKKKYCPTKKQPIPNTSSTTIRINCMHKSKAKSQRTLASKVHLGTSRIRASLRVWHGNSLFADSTPFLLSFMFLFSLFYYIRDYIVIFHEI